MSGDIVERLRWLGSIDCPYGCDEIGNPAADEIERLQGLLADHGYHGPDCKFGNCWCDESKEAR